MTESYFQRAGGRMPQSAAPRAEAEGGPVWEAQGEAGQAARQELVKYGELVILGYNGALPQGDKGRRRSKFILYRRSR
jgi:pellino protein